MSKTYTVSVPTVDQTGHLSPLVLDAIKAGATVALDPADVHNTLVVAFTKPGDAKAFEAAVKGETVEKAVDKPVEDTPPASE